jgi:hypothetical protein
MHFSKDNKLVQLTENLLLKAVDHGISNEGELIVKEYIEYNEFGLAFEHIIYELNENNINISYEYYIELKKVADLMKIDENEYHPQLEKLIL